MKLSILNKNKNLFLFLLLMLLIALTYWFEERGNENFLKVEAGRTEILNADKLGELKRVKGIKIDFNKKGENYFAADNGLLLSRARIDEFFKILSGLKVKTFLKDEDVNKVGRNFYIGDDALKLTFVFEKGSIAFTLGKKLSFDQTFYMEIEKGGKKEMVIASDESPDPGVYQNDKDYERSEAKYKRLQIVFMLTNLYFYDTKLFKGIYEDLEKLNFKEMTISTFRNKKYSINFKDTTTSPPAPKGIGYFEDNWISFYRMLTNLEARSVITPYEPTALSEVLSQLEILDRQGRQITLTVYKKFGDQSGYFLTSSLDKILYVLKPDDARYFFVNVQDFWRKSFAPKTKEYQLGISFYGHKKDEVNISDKELFRASSATSHVVTRPLEFKKLIDFLKVEGDRVSELTEKPSEIIKQNIMQLYFDNRVLNVMLLDNEVVLVDLDLKIKIHYYVGASIPFSIKRSDYFQ